MSGLRKAGFTENGKEILNFQHCCDLRFLFRRTSFTLNFVVGVFDLAIPKMVALWET
jgi:hypothetical protein